MPKAKSDLEMVAVRLYHGDRERLQRLFPVAGYNKAIRELVRKYLARVDEISSRVEKGKVLIPVPTDIELELRSK